MSSMEEQFAAMQLAQQQATETMQKILIQNEDLHARLEAKEKQISNLLEQNAAAAAQNAAAAAASAMSAPPGHGQNHGSALVQKWAPDSFSGEHGDWREWATKYRSYMGALLQGSVGRWLKQTEEAREKSGLVASLGEAARATSSILHSALIATCKGKAFVIVERVTPGEGLEAWRLLVHKYEPRTKQTRLMRMLEVLGFDVSNGNLMDSLEEFDRLVAKYEGETKKLLTTT